MSKNTHIIRGVVVGGLLTLCSLGVFGLLQELTTTKATVRLNAHLNEEHVTAARAQRTPERVRGSVQGARVGSQNVSLFKMGSDHVHTVQTSDTGEFDLQMPSVSIGETIVLFTETAAAIISIGDNTDVSRVTLQEGEVHLHGTVSNPLQLGALPINTLATPLPLFQDVDGLDVTGLLVVPAGSHVLLDTDIESDGLLVAGNFNQGQNEMSIHGNFEQTGGVFRTGDSLLTINGSLIMTAGTFEGGNGDIDVLADFVGSFDLRGGLFRAPRGTLTIHADWNHTGGTYDNNTGTVRFGGTSHMFTGLGAETLFHHLVVDMDDQSGLEIGPAHALRVTRVLSLLDGEVRDGQIFVGDQMVHAPEFDGGTSELVIEQSGNGILLSPGGNVPGLRIQFAVETQAVLATHREGLDVPADAVITFESPVIVERGNFNLFFVNSLFEPTAPVTVRGGNMLVQGAGNTTILEGDATLTSGAITNNEGDVLVNGTLRVLDGRLVNYGLLTVNGDTDVSGGTLQTSRSDFHFGGNFNFNGGLLSLGSGRLQVDGITTIDNGRYTGFRGTAYYGGPLNVLNGRYNAGSYETYADSITVDPQATYQIRRGGTVRFEGASSTVDFGGSVSLQSVEVAMDDNETLTFIQPLTALTSLTLSDGAISASAVVTHGTTVVEGGFDGSDASLEVIGRSDQSLTLGSPYGFDGGIVIDKQGSTARLTSDVSLITPAMEILVSNGNLDLQEFNVELSAVDSSLRVADGATLKLAGTQRVVPPILDEGSTVHLMKTDGTVTIPDWEYRNLIVGLPGTVAYLVPATGLTVLQDLMLLGGSLAIQSNEVIAIGGSLRGNGGTLLPGNGTVVFDGDIQQIEGSHTFYNLTKELTNASDALIVESGTTQVFENDLILRGLDCDFLRVRASQANTAWTADIRNQSNIEAVDIQDTTITSAAELLCGGECVDQGNVTGLTFDALADCTALSFECGNGAIEEEEQCDDENLVPGDGCNELCEIEPGFLCESEPSSCNTECGDGLIMGTEQCDDNNTDVQDGCNDLCEVEEGYVCNGEPSSCDTECGDGLLMGFEECDDENEIDGDGCSSLCTVEVGFSCTVSSPSICGSVCGDGLITGEELCDDENVEDGDGCDSSCLVEQQYQCTGEPSDCLLECGEGFLVSDADVCIALEFQVNADICGNGVKEEAEECDDGDTDNYDQCSNSCVLAQCGDGIKQHREECDDGNSNNNDSCLNTCRFAMCGDYILNTDTEECDPPGIAQPDLLKDTVRECLPGCVFGDAVPNAKLGAFAEDQITPEEISRIESHEQKIENQIILVENVCGDSIVDDDEECDHGSLNGIGPCSYSCTFFTCGDGIYSPHLGEECDDGNDNDTDSCTNSCTFPIEETMHEEVESIVTPEKRTNNTDTEDVVDDSEDEAEDAEEPTETEELHEAAPEERLDLDVVDDVDVAECGNFIVDAGEECDDGNVVNGDGCTARCTIESFVAAAGACGNGVIDAGEECDNGDLNSDIFPNQCRTSCRLPRCGDFIQDAGEDCDGSFNCSNMCTALPQAICGDGKLEGSELCDDGNVTPNDGCNQFCITEVIEHTSEDTTETEPEPITGITIQDEKHMLIRFDEPLDPIEALNPDNYVVTGSPRLPIERVELLDPYTVRLVFEKPLEVEHLYTVAVEVPTITKEVITYTTKVEREVPVVEELRDASVTHDVMIEKHPAHEEAAAHKEAAPVQTVIPVSSAGPYGNTGPAAVLFISLGAAAGYSAVKKKRKLL